MIMELRSFRWRRRREITEGVVRSGDKFELWARAFQIRGR